MLRCCLSLAVVLFLAGCGAEAPDAEPQATGDTVAEDAAFKHYGAWVDGVGVYHWSDSLGRWQNICELCDGATGVRLPGVVFSPAAGTAIGAGIDIGA